jgi:hypothetical protein
MTMRMLSSFIWVAAIILFTGSAVGAELPLGQVVEALVHAAPDKPADFPGKDLSFLDLISNERAWPARTSRATI